MGGARRSVVAAISVSTACAMPVFLVGALAVQVRGDLGFSKAALGLAPTVFFTVGAVGSALAGRFVERVGPRRGMRIGATGAAVAMAGTGAVAGTWPTVLAFLAVGGLANAIAQPGSNLLLARSVAEARQGTAFGIKQSAIPTATLLGGLAVPAVALTVGWRWAFAGGAAFALATTALVPESGEMRSNAEPATLAKGRTGPLLLLAAAAGLGAAAANTLGTFLVESSVDAGVAEGNAGLLFALGSGTGLAMRLAVGALADRTTRRHEFRGVAAMLVGGSLGYGLLATGQTALVVPGAMLAFGLGWGWPGLFNYSVVSCHRDAPAAATGVTQTGVYTGAMVGPVTFGVLVEQTSFSVAWLASLGASLVAAVAVAAGARVLERRLDDGLAAPPG